ncbi:ankyrin repeat and KH domain-containing protein 1-like [Haliotis rufescens]|uniref:ankyrin repeat and KH domain-containing protein 1-like n=1 Tax=Haliotis rufescens TaxID=6454 RepID=UPI00201F068E|nr:ankyrin repeat and KH domain-containing protein 1-like [Haliotis rufescens]
MFGYPLICSLYTSNPDFHVLSPQDFFQNPVTYLRGHLDTIVRERSSRSAALILLLLCDGKLDLVSFQLGKGETDMFQVVKEVVPSCTPTEIGNEIGNFTGTYCTVEKNMAFFSHPSIYDATACAFGNYNPSLLLKHCSLKFLYERVKREKRGQQQLGFTDDVTNLIHLSPGLYPFVLTRLVEEGADLSLTDKGNSDCLMLACKKGNMSFVKHLLSLKTLDINRKRGSDMQTLVMMAADWGNYDVYNLLVSEGADLSLTDEENRDCLMLACKEGNMSIVKHLLSLKTFDINRKGGSDMQTPVMMAAAVGHYDVYNLLVSEGADLSLTDKYNSDCLMLACKEGNMSIVKHLLSLKTFDINRKGGSDMQTPVMMAAAGGHYDVYNLLVSEGADLSLTDDDNSDCLMLACEGGNMSVVKHLLSLKTFDINRKGGNDMQTPVMMAVKKGHYDMHNLIVSEGPDLSLTDEVNSDCLVLACQGGNMSIVKHLLSPKTFDINRNGGFFMQTPVMIAAAWIHYDVYNLLVSEGADLSLTDKDNSDCLMLACKEGNMSIVKHLLSLKTFDINRKGGFFMQTPVMMAVEKGHYNLYNLLVSHGADLSLTDKYNSDCLTLACKKGNMSILKHLLSLKTFDINRKGGFFMQTPVMMAVDGGHYGVYNLLVSEGADLSLTDTFNRDCLTLACQEGNMSIVKHLLSLKTFDINRKRGFFMQTPVMMAVDGGHYEGADLSLTDAENSDCLMLACKGGNMSIVRHLLSLKTFDINRKGGSDMQTPVMMAAERGHYDVYNLLVSEGADLSLTD